MTLPATGASGVATGIDIPRDGGRPARRPRGSRVPRESSRVTDFAAGVPPGPVKPGDGVYVMRPRWRTPRASRRRAPRGTVRRRRRRRRGRRAASGGRGGDVQARVRPCRRGGYPFPSNPAGPVPDEGDRGPRREPRRLRAQPPSRFTARPRGARCRPEPPSGEVERERPAPSSGRRSPCGTRPPRDADRRPPSRARRTPSSHRLRARRRAPRTAAPRRRSSTAPTRACRAPRPSRPRARRRRNGRRSRSRCPCRRTPARDSTKCRPGAGGRSRRSRRRPLAEWDARVVGAAWDEPRGRRRRRRSRGYGPQFVATSASHVRRGPRDRRRVAAAVGKARRTGGRSPGPPPVGAAGTPPRPRAWRRWPRARCDRRIDAGRRRSRPPPGYGPDESAPSRVPGGGRRAPPAVPTRSSAADLQERLRAAGQDPATESATQVEPFLARTPASAVAARRTPPARRQRADVVPAERRRPPPRRSRSRSRA